MADQEADGKKNIICGYCPVCHNLKPLEQVDPEYPDDPMADETDYFVLGQHADSNGQPCVEGAGKNPTGFENDHWMDDSPEFDAGGPEDETRWCFTQWTGCG